MRQRLQSYAYVSIQFGCIGYIALSAPVIPGNAFFFSLEIVSIVLGVWSIGAMRVSNLSAIPDVKPDGVFVSRGPYKWIRHPMYSSVLGFTLALVLEYLTIERIVVWSLLCIDLLLKLSYEEKLLKARFENYTSYATKTKRLLPFFF